MRLTRWVATLVVVLSPPLGAQAAARRLDAPLASSGCTYLSCAYGIAPAWNGLDVVNGSDGGRVASLGFFWPRSVAATFAGNDSATHFAARALTVRRAAAGFTDIGALLLGYAAVRQLTGGLHGRDRIAGVAGAGAFAVGVPLQFSADALLSRAVWWHNARYAR